MWEHLYAELKEAIRGGVLSPAEKLPSKRALASHLGVSVVTVAAAYSQLISEGWLYSIERKGFFVTDMERFPQRAYGRRAHGAAVRSESEAKRIGGRSARGVERRGEPFFADFTDNSTALEKFPFSQWSLIIRKILRRPTSVLLSRSGIAGLPELRGEISSYLLRFRNIKVKPERIIVCPGTEYAYGMLVQILGRDKVYAVENPGYRKTAETLRANGAECRPVEMDADGIMPDTAEAYGVSVIHVSPSHHYPTGKIMPIKRRLELLSWGDTPPKNIRKVSHPDGIRATVPRAYATAGRWIIEDDYDSEFRFTGKPLETLQSLSEKSGGSRVIYINTFSKTLAPSFRISYIVLPERLAEEYPEKIGFLSCAVPNLDQLALAEFMANGNFETHIIRMKNHYRTTRNNLIAAIKGSALSGVSKITEADAGLHFLLALNTEISGDALREKLRTGGINAALLSDYFHPSPKPPYGKTHRPVNPYADGRGVSSETQREAERTLVINYSGLRREKITEAVRRMEKALLS